MNFVYHETPIDILAREAGYSRISMDENPSKSPFYPHEKL